MGHGDNLYQFVHADDLAEACILASTKPGATSFNCGAERFGTMRQALESLCRHAGTGSRVRSVPMLPARLAMDVTSAVGLSPLGAYHSLMYGRSLYFDISRATRELGWHPRYSNEEMLAQSYDWYCANRETVLSGTGGSHHRSPVREGALAIARRLL
jgi:nucleoside-diphosphate-sugar epimerase